MILKENQTNNPIIEYLKRYRFSFNIAKVLLSILVVLGFIIFLAVKFTLVLKEDGIKSRFIFENLDKIPGQYLAGLATTPDRIVIDIKHKQFQKLAFKRKVALERSLLVSSPDDWVPAKIRYGTKTLKAKLRLKGDMLDHLGDEKWSFRVKLKGDDTLFGMKVFSIQHPKTRGYIAEWLLHEIAKLENIISLRYKFANVVVNGKDLGIFAIEEHIDKRLIENNARREGPVIKFDEANWWSERLEFMQRIEYPIEIMGGTLDQQRQGVGSYYSMPVDAFGVSAMMKNPVLRKNFAVAHEMIEKFRLGELTTSQVFDVEKLASYIALNDLFGNRHALHTNNLRFYYNPIVARLEIVPFDAGSISQLKGLTSVKADVSVWGGNNKRLFLYRVFEDLAFYEVYLQALERFSKPQFMAGVLTSLAEPMQAALNIIYTDYPYFIFNDTFFVENQNYIRYVLNPENAVQVYSSLNVPGQIELEVGNKQDLPVEVLGISSGSAFFKPVLKNRILLPGKSQSEPMAYRAMRFRIPSDLHLDLKRATLQYKILGTNKLKQQSIAVWPRLNNDFAQSSLIRNDSDISKIEWLLQAKGSKSLFIKPGKWTISKHVVIPPYYRVFASAGTELNLINRATFISRSAIEFVGTENKPIIIKSSDKTGAGFMVIDGAEQSIVKHVVFVDLANPDHGGWSTTGAVTFFQSPVAISHTVFKSNHAEDALNIIRCDYEIVDSLFEDAQSDAFDADFAKGSIRHSVFANSFNDAIDVSGSYLSVEDVAIVTAGDKGLSAGEGSTIVVNDIRIKGTEIAVASKDLSTIKIEGLRMENNTIGFAVFQKKPEFGAARVTVTGITDNQKKKNYLVETGSSLVIDDIAITPNNSKVKALLYGAQFGKKTVR